MNRRMRNKKTKNNTKLFCEDVESGSHDCYENTDYGQCVDKCLVQEINYLNAIGIETIGCCCGHNRNTPYVQVDPKFIDKMKDMGYHQQPIVNDMGYWCFYPKSKLSKDTRKWSR